MSGEETLNKDAKIVLVYDIHLHALCANPRARIRVNREIELNGSKIELVFLSWKDYLFNVIYHPLDRK